MPLALFKTLSKDDPLMHPWDLGFHDESSISRHRCTAEDGAVTLSYTSWPSDHLGWPR